MDPQQAVLYTADDILDVVQRRYASSIIGNFIRMTPHSPPPTKDDTFHGGNYEPTPIGREMNGLMELIIQERGIRIAEDDNFTLFALTPDRSANQYVTIPQREAVSTEVIRRVQLNGRIDEAVKEVMAHSREQKWGTLLEQEFLQVTTLYDALKRFDHAYFTSFKERHGLPYDDILQARFAMISEAPLELKKAYGDVREDSPLAKAIHNLVDKSRQTADFQLSGRVPGYAGEYTVMARLPKFIQLNQLFVSERVGEMDLEEVKRGLRYPNEQHPHYDFVVKWNSLFSIEKRGSVERDYTSMPVEDLELSVRAQNALRDANIKTIAELSQKTREELRKLRNMGRNAIKEINDALGEMGITLKEE